MIPARPLSGHPSLLPLALALSALLLAPAAHAEKADRDKPINIESNRLEYNDATKVSTFIGNLIAYQGPPPASGVMHGVPMWMGWWALLVMPVTIALAEEGLYRGYAAEALESRLHKIAALVVIAFFFALQHTALTSLSPRAQVARFVTTFLGGLLFGGMRWRWRGGLWSLVVAHWGLDVLGLGLPILLASQAS